MELGAPGGDLREVECGAYHKFHFVGLRDLQKGAIELPYFQFLPHLTFGAQPFEQMERGIVDYTLISDPFYRRNVPCVLLGRYPDDILSSEIFFMHAMTSLTP